MKQPALVLLVSILAFPAGAMAMRAVRTQDQQPVMPRKTLFEKSQTPLPANVYCKMDGLEITRAEFGDWLQKFRGDNAIQEYITGRLIRQAAKKYNVEATAEEVDQIVSRRIEERILNGYRGRKELFEERELANLGKTLNDAKLEESWEVEGELLVKKILKSRRLTTDADVEKEFNRLYGKSGREMWLRAILLEINPPAVTSHKSHEELAAIQKKALEDAFKKGVDAIKRIKSGATDFATQALASSDDNQSRVRGGDIGQYVNQPQEFGPEFDELIHKAKIGELIGPVRIQAGFIVAEITKEIVHDIRKERDAIRTELKERAPTHDEIQEYVGRLLLEAKLVR
ncbi:MAG: peptidylprolyl isomerase [Planctomycetota bacterium]